MFSTISIFLYTLLLTKASFSKDIINQTCKACSETTPFPLSYDFCSASLGSVPVSHASNLQGLGLVSLELAFENATNTLAVVTEMLQDNSKTCTDCLRTCLEVYTGVTVKLRECVADFVAMKYDPVFMWVILIREATEICEEEFWEEGSESPLTFENYSLTQLCSIVICIMEQLLALPSSLANTLRIM